MDSIPLGMTLDETRVKISPLVPSIILDYNLRNWVKEENNEENTIGEVSYDIKINDYTIGVLLGVEIGSNVVITNAFGTKYKKDGKLDEDYINFMVKYMTKGTKEAIVGMFHVSKINQDINEFEVVKAYATIREMQTAKQSK
jgi:hypothetical protein